MFKFLKRFFWLFAFAIFVSVFSSKIFLRNYVIGPFDFLNGFFHPYMDIWQEPLRTTAIQYKNFLMSDVVTVVLPIKLFAMDLVKHLQFPFWNPYILNGSPLFANVQSAVLYPLNIFYLIFDQPTAYNLYVISQLFLSFFFMFIFLRNHGLDKLSSYFGALAFSFSAFFIVWLPWGTLGHAFLWLPLILFLLDMFFLKQEGKYAVFFVLGLVSSFFAGHTQTSIVVFATTAAYLLFKLFSTDNRKAFIKSALFFGIAILLVSIQLLPSFEMYNQSNRELAASESFYKDQTLYPSAYLTSFAPDFFGNPVTRNMWGKMNYAETAIYFGALPLYFLAYFFLQKNPLKKPLSKFLLGVLISGVLLSTQNPISYLIFKLKVPLLSSSTFSRYSMIYIFSATILSSFGFYYFLRDVGNKDYGKINKNNLLFGSLLLILWLLVLVKILPENFKENIGVIKRNLILPSLVVLSAIVISFANRITQKIKFHSNVVAVLLILILSFELLRFAGKYTPFSPREFFYPNYYLIGELQKLTKNNRYYNYFPSNINSMYSVRGVEGGEPLYSLSLAEVAGLGNGLKKPTDRAAMQFAGGPHKERVLDLFSVRYFVDKTDNFRNSWIDEHGKNDKLYDDRFREFWHQGLYKVYTNKYFVERQGLYFSAKYIKDKNKLLKTLISKDFDPRKEIIVDRNLKLGGKGKGIIKIEKDEPTSQKYSVDTTAPAVFAVTDTFYPGWKVNVNGEIKEIIRVNHAFRGVLLNKGRNEVIFSYDPVSFKIGFLLSLAGTIIFILLLWKKDWLS